MSTVVSRAARRRWAAVTAGTALLVGSLVVTPWAWSAVGVAPTTTSPTALVERALASDDVAYSATGESRGALALPDLRGFDGLASLLGGTTRTRVWWAAPTRWRVDVVGLSGEQDTYGLDTSITTWDYESRRLVTVAGEPVARLPRADDLLPPQAVRRLLASLGPSDRLSLLPARRVGGREADGLRIVPGDRRSTVARADVWLDRATGLPLRLLLVDARGGDALVTALSGVTTGRPDDDVLTPPAPPNARRELDRAPDLVSRIAQRSPWSLPDELAGLPATDPAVEGTGTYGDGLVRVAVLPLPDRLSGDVVGSATAAGSVAEEVPGGRLVRIGSSLLNVVLAVGEDGEHAYVLAGLVEPALLDAVAADLFATPPARSLR
ncbi:sigma-E factor regulatory protein RseB domain-containing protein [Phycicoccus avicenniae]|uniref:sigma-E factor regulatory protein RseB domain-containing protein n=1 Tax=Phycicoccus avicenniae TaxID=2828860 RepID=UPI003D268CC6